EQSQREDPMPRANDTSLSINRRQLVKGLSAVGGMSGMGNLAAFAPTGPIRFGIYGSATKLATRGKAIARFAELHPEYSVVFEGVPSDAWPDKISAVGA